MRKIIHANSYHGYDLSYSSKNVEGFYEEMLECIESYLDFVTDDYKKAFFVMFVVRYPTGMTEYLRNNNTRFLKFVEALRIYYKRRNYKPMYFWAREHSVETDQWHYHLSLVLDGNKEQNGFNVLEKVTQLWEHSLGIGDGRGLVELCEVSTHNRYGGVKIDHRDPSAPRLHRMCFEWISYLAKVYSKGKTPGEINQYGCSRIPKRRDSE